MVRQSRRHVGQGEAEQSAIFFRIAEGFMRKVCELAAVLTAAA